MSAPSNVTPLRPEPGAAARVPPRNLEAEQALLGAMLVNNDAFGRVAAFLKAEHFSEELHRRIFDVASTLIGAGKLANPVTMKTYFADADIGGTTVAQYLARLAAEATTVVNALDYGRTVHDLAVRRGLIEIAGELVEVAYDPPLAITPPQIAAEAVDRILSAVASATQDGTRRTAAELGAAAIERVSRIRSGEIKDDGVPTGFRRLDDLTGGYRPEKLWLVGARPGMGKSVFAVTSALKVARRGTGVKVFSLELPESEIRSRLLADLAYAPRHPIAYQQIDRGTLDDTEFWQVDAAQKRLVDMPLVIDCASRLTVADIRARIHAERGRMARRGTLLGVVFIDYMKMIQASDRYRGNRVEEIGEITGGLKQIAKDEKVCIVLLVQLLRVLDKQEDKRPALSDLRGSGDLEADADVVMFLHREAYHIEKSSEFRKGDADAADRLAQCKYDAELIVGKNRGGAEGTVKLWCNIASSTMASHAPEMM